MVRGDPEWQRLMAEIDAGRLDARSVLEVSRDILTPGSAGQAVAHNRAIGQNCGQEDGRNPRPTPAENQTKDDRKRAGQALDFVETGPDS